MNFRSLIEMCDKRIKEDIKDYYFISKDRMEELINNFEKQCGRIKELSSIISDQQYQIEKLQKELITNAD